MAEQRRPVGWAPVCGAILTLGSAAFIGFWVSRMHLAGLSIERGDLQALSVAAVIGLGGGTALMMKVRRVETARSILPSFTFMAIGGALGVGVAAAVLGTSLVGIGVLLALAAVLGGGWWRRNIRIHRIVTRGRRVTAEFVDVRAGESDTTSEYEGVRYLIRYTDEAGTIRDLRGSTNVPSGRIPSPGDSLTLWYQPENPRRHVVRLAPEQA